MEFAVINFLITDDVAVVPTTWLLTGKKEGWWPPYKNMARLMAAVKKREKVNNSTWTKHSLRVMKEYDSYDEARRHLEKSRYTSNLESESEIELSPEKPSRKRKNDGGNKIPEKRKVQNSDNEDSSDVEHGPNVSPPPAFSSQGLGILRLAEGSGTRNVEVTPAKSHPSSNNMTTPRRTLSQREGSTNLSTPRRALSQRENLTSNNFRSGSRNVIGRNSRVDAPVPALNEFVVKSLERLHQKSDLQGELIVKILGLLENVSTPAAGQGEFEFVFPMDSMNQVDVLEQKIENALEYKNLVNYLAWFGGADYKENLRRILSHLLADDLALQFAWEGIRKVNPKRPFKDLKLKNAVFDAVKKNRLIQSVTEKELKVKGASWFQHASDRIKATVASSSGRSLQHSQQIPEPNDPR